MQWFLNTSFSAQGFVHLKLHNIAEEVAEIIRNVIIMIILTTIIIIMMTSYHLKFRSLQQQPHLIR